MTSESTPLVSSSLPNNEHELVYRRFSPTYKKFIVTMASWCGLMYFFIIGSFLPSIPQVARDLNTTGQTISLAVSLSVFATAIGTWCAAAYSTFYGRRPMYIIALPLSTIGSIGVATAQGIPQLMFWRFWQVSGASAGISVGAGVIGDIYKLEERGTAMGFYLAGRLLGQVLAPLIGGFVAYYTSWRTMQHCLGTLSSLAFVVIFLSFPETSQPGTRGIDKLRQVGQAPPRWVPVFINPLRPLNLIRSPNLFGVSVAGSLILLTSQVLLIPLAYTIGKRYQIDGNAALVGACYLPSGLGSISGALISGRISDRIVKHSKEKRGGIWYPEDRLRAATLGALIFAPISIIACGLVTHYIEGPTGLTLSLISIFLNGFGVALTLGPSAAYAVDVMHSRSAESMAFNGGFRSLLLSFATTAIFPMIYTYGLVVTNILSAVLAWIGAVIILVIVRYGEEMRAWVDVGYSTVNDN